MSVRTYLVRRFALLLLVLVGISLVTFLLVRVVPSDPAANYVGPRARPEQIEEARHILGLNRPLYLQYAIYVGDLVRGDWGTSIRTRRPVLGDILTFLPLSLELVITTLALSISVGVLLGALTAHMKGRWVDHVMRVFAIGGVSGPLLWCSQSCSRSSSSEYSDCCRSRASSTLPSPICTPSPIPPG